MTRASLVVGGVLVIAATLLTWAHGETSAQAPNTKALVTELAPVSSFEEIPDRDARSVALFTEAGRVFQHPRCMNCHPATERPTQTDRLRPHQPPVVRGARGHGAAVMPCSACHHATNFDAVGIPGDPEWQLAPASMVLQGRSLAQICSQIKDRSLNGDRDIAALIRHVSEDSLVGWAWTPGAARAPAPGTQAQFVDLIKAWAATGAACPA
jgi:hypothetical protein